MIEAHLIPGTAEVETWAPVTDVSELAHVPALERDLHLWDEGGMFVWAVEMDTKYSTSEAVNTPYAPAGQAIARFYPPEVEDEEYDFSIEPTQLIITLPAEGTWRLRALGGRYDHFIVLYREA